MISHGILLKLVRLAHPPCYVSCKQAEQIPADDWERLDQLHYKVENALLKLIESLQKKQSDKEWDDNFHYR